MSTTPTIPDTSASPTSSQKPGLRQLLNRIITPTNVRRLAVATSICIFLVYAMGTLVTDTGSGHGCGQSWPLCKGKFIPEFAISTAIEFSHRVVVALITPLIILLAIGLLWLWRARIEVRVLVPIMVVGLFAEAGLGAALVLAPQSPVLLAVHFGSSLILFSSILLATFLIFEFSGWDRLRDRPVPGGFRLLTIALLLFTYVVGYLGAYLRLRGAELGCTTWPLCKSGQLFSGFSGPAGMVFTHRLAALCLTIGTLVLFFWARRMRSARPDLYRGSLWALGLVLAQSLAGAIVVFSKVAEQSQMLHAGLVALLFAALCYTALHSLPRQKSARSIVTRPATNNATAAEQSVASASAISR